MNDMRYATMHVSACKGSAVMSTPKVDRVGDSIDLDGWDLADFAANPVMLYEHRRDEPVGVWKNLRKEGGALVGDPVFHPAEINPFADRLRKMYEGGWLKAFSVGFVPVEIEPMPGTSGYRIKRAKLLECSCVTVPANTDALMKSDGRPMVPVFKSDHPFATPEARRAGRNDAACKAFAHATESRKIAPMDIAALLADPIALKALKSALGTIHEEQPAAPPPPTEGAGADAEDEPEDLLALALVETEAATAESDLLIAEIENEA